MPSADIVVSTPIERTARVLQLEGLFEVAPSQRSEVGWTVKMPLEKREWAVGLIVGPSGSGKSTIMRHFWPEQSAKQFSWPEKQSVVDAFPTEMSIKDIVALLSSVGFSSPPSWLRPFSVLSTGEQFRVTMARLLAESPELAVVDEFTSVVDRRVAQIGSAALAKTVRRRGQRLIAVTCHYDVLEWLQPDWVYDTAVQECVWRSLQRRPGITLTVCRVHHSAWRLFARYHYLDHEIATGAHCYVGLDDVVPVVFGAVMPMVGHGLSGKNAWRHSRIVVLPDWQGVGLGIKFGDVLASAYRGVGMRYYATMSHPTFMQALARSTSWALVRKPSFGRQVGRGHYRGKGSRGKHAMTRVTAGFEFVGEPMERTQALRLIGWDDQHRARCRAHGCSRDPVARGLCALHYQRSRRAAA